MFMIEIAGLKVLYTGDISRELDRHLVPAEVPIERPDVMIGESTFGTMALEGRVEKEERFLSKLLAVYGLRWQARELNALLFHQTRYRRSSDEVAAASSPSLSLAQPSSSSSSSTSTGPKTPTSTPSRSTTARTLLANAWRYTSSTSTL